MFKNIHITLILLVISLGFSGKSKAQKNPTNMQNVITQEWIISDLIKKWEGNKTFTLNVLKAMPEEYYDFKPVEGMMSFYDQVSHIASGFNFHLKAAGLNTVPKLKGKDKASLITAYTKIFDEIINILKRTDTNFLRQEKDLWYGETTKGRILNLMDNHLAHHRGQLIVYLRLKGVKAPGYIGW